MLGKSKVQVRSTSAGVYVCVWYAQLCLALCDRMDYSPKGSSVHGILQARTVEWVAMPSSRGSCRPRDQTLRHLCFLHCRWILYHWATWEAPHLVWELLQKISLHSDFSAETMSARCQRHPDGSGGLSHQHRLPLRCCLVETASTDLWGLEQWPGKTPEGRNTANVCLN